MAANVLNSERAVDASVQVFRAFVKLRHLLASSADLARKVDALDAASPHEVRAYHVFDAIKKLMMPPVLPKTKIGFVGTKKKK